MKKHLCFCGEVMETKGAFHHCARCSYVYKNSGGGGLEMVKINGAILPPQETGLAWFAKMRAAL